MKKLTVLILLFSILFLSCKKEKVSVLNPANPSSTEDPLILKARSYFETSVLQAGPTSVGNLDPRQVLKKSPVWEKAYISVTAKQDVVAVPLKFEKPMKFKAGGNELELNRQSKLLIYEGSDGKMKAEVVTYIPDQAGDQGKFSGIIMVEDWAGNKVNRFIYQNGQAFRLVDNRTNLINASGDCIKIDWYLCDIDEMGHTSNCQYMYSEYIGACNQGLEPPGESGGYEEYIEIERAATKTWKVLSNPYDASDTRAIWSTERVRYKLVPTEPEGGHFTTPSNWSNSCDFCGYFDRWDPSHLWSHPTSQLLRVDVYGSLNYLARTNSFGGWTSWTMASMPH